MYFFLVNLFLSLSLSCLVAVMASVVNHATSFPSASLLSRPPFTPAPVVGIGDPDLPQRVMQVLKNGQPLVITGLQHHPSWSSKMNLQGLVDEHGQTSRFHN
jgi:hypothetical protein